MPLEPHRDDCLAGRPQFLVDLGVESESQINRRVIDPDEPLLLTLEQMEQQATKRREERIQAQRKQQEKEQAGGRHLPILGLSEWKRGWQNVTGSLRGQKTPKCEPC